MRLIELFLRGTCIFLSGIVLGSFFYGYIFTQLPGGWLAAKYGAKRVFGFGVFWTSLLTLLTPVAAKFSVYVLVLLRILEGLGEVRVLMCIIITFYTCMFS